MEPGSVGQDAELVAFPGVLEGDIQVQSRTEFAAIEALYRHAVLRDRPYRVDLVAGWRFQRLRESLLISDFKRSVDPGSGMVVGTTLEGWDRFDTQNEFHGPEVGMLTERRWGPWTCELTTKLALGNTHTQAAISGATTVTVPIPDAPADVTQRSTGLLALPSNIGVYDRDVFSVVPEVGLTLSCDLTYRLRATVGYTLLFWSPVTRPGHLIDPNLNLSQLEAAGLVGPARPRFDWLSSGVTVQGLNVGLDYRF